MVFGALKKAFGSGTNKLNGRLDLLEGVCAAAALIAYADGDAGDAELEATIKSIKASKSISEAFPQTDIEKTIDKMFERAKGGRVGRLNLKKEITEVASRGGLADDAETILMTALEVAEAEGGIDGAEKKVLEDIAKSLGLNLGNYL